MENYSRDQLEDFAESVFEGFKFYGLDFDPHDTDTVPDYSTLCRLFGWIQSAGARLTKD